MSVCILDQAGETWLHRHMTAPPEALRKAMAPYRDQIVLAAECLLTWYGLADLCAREGIPFVLGHALYMTAIHGGQATHDPIAAPKIAVRLRGGMLPQADVDPAHRRATRDRLRRRRPLAHTRAALLAHVQQTHSQSNLPALGQKMADQANRDGVAERLADPAVHQRIDVDLALISDDDERLGDVERTLVTTATPHDANPLSLLPTAPGIGTILSRVLRYDIHAIHRFPRVQDVGSSGRWVNCAQASAGQRLGTAGRKLGTAQLTWAFSAAAVLFLRDHPAAQQDRARLEKTHDPGNALTGLAHQWARAV